MLTAAFGRELAEVQLKEALRQAEHNRLVGCLKRQRLRRERAAAVRRKPAAPCPRDLG
jgi:hypothetical protein